MRLERIVLDGFKSFADKTEFAFDASITAIVGPNGCGKSNIVDAVKWVLGEQSVKSLRSGQMADVIFGGSSSRKAVGTAEVSLFISDTAGSMPIETDEVQISRRIYKSGESEYRINNKICRLKDIRELFMDTGVGSKAYSIIEQGQIEQLLSASKSDRRAIFEEAAGISKYKSHKKEAVRKLERTEQNLLRLADILGEVSKRLRSVKLAAGKARNYLQYSERLKELQVNYSLSEFAKIKTTNAEKVAILEGVNEQFAAVAAEVSKNDSLMSELGRQIIETENELNQMDNSVVSVESKIAQHLQRIEFLRARITELEHRKSGAADRMEKLQHQEKQFFTDLSQYKAEQSGCEKTLVEKNGAVEELEDTVQQINAECNCLQADLEDEKSGIIDIVRTTAQLHNEIQSISVYRDNLSGQKDRLSSRAERSGAELEQLLTEKAQHKARLSDIEKVLIELQENLDSNRKEMGQIETLVSAGARRMAHSKETRSALSGELSILKDMEGRREGLNTAVKSILEGCLAERSKLDYIEGILADIVVADIEYASAVEAALEGQTDAVVVASATELLSDTETIEKLDGRVNFLCMDKTEPFVDSKDLSCLPGVEGRVVEFVTYESQYASLVWKLLGKTIIVDSIDTAGQLSAELGADYKFVTRQGGFLCSDGSIKLGPLGKTTGLISRKSRLRQLEGTIADVASEITHIEAEIKEHEVRKVHLDKLCKDLRTAVYEANTEKMQVSSNLTVIEQNVSRLTEEQPLITGEIEVLESQIDQSVQKQYSSKQKLEELDAVNSQRSARIEELETRYAEQKDKQQTLLSQLTDLKVAIGQITEHQQALLQAIESVSSQMRENLSSSKSAQAEVQNCDQQLRQAQIDILDCESAVSELFVDKEKKQQGSSLLHTRVEELLEKQKQTEQLVVRKRAEEDEIEQKINGLKIELGQLEVKQQDLVERVRDELGIDLVLAYEDYEDKQVDWEGVREEIVQLRGRIERLGNVNVDAISEQETLEKRNLFLSSQVEDLTSSKRQLQQLIGRLNGICRDKFKTTFEEIRGHFQQIFRKLFGGGKADILLGDPEDNEDILEAGIEIIARPPGKETRSISLLSGGEKAMTAIALLFAVFKAKPSPFCFLDEVDAALDEANNERFNLLLREFQKDSQFIIITHAKRTMSIADMLYGITMQIRGVSKKISVRFDEYDHEGAAVA